MTYRSWCLFAGLLSLAIAALHVVGGGSEFHEPALASAMPVTFKAVFSVIWHEVTALLVLNGIFLLFAALSLHKNTALLLLILGLNLCFAALFIFYGITRLGTAMVHLQWTLFAAMSGVIFIALAISDKRPIVREVPVMQSAGGTLPGHDFADSYERIVESEGTALGVAQRILNQRIGWIDALMKLRNVLVRPFGLAGERADMPHHQNFVSFFPVLHESPDRVVLGLNDKHLDFRLVIDVKRHATQLHVVATTLVKSHNMWGRWYLAVALPFHRLIVQTMLQRA